MRMLFPLVLVLLAEQVVSAETPNSYDWPQWQGTERNAVSQQPNLLKEWPADGPELAWTATGLGGGYSTPAIAKGYVYGMSNRDGKEIVWSLSEKDGSEVWATSLGPESDEGGRQGSEGPAGTPTVDGDRLYVMGATGLLAYLEVADGTIVWKRNIREDFGGRLPTWRYTESPLVDGNKVICTPGGTEATLVALDKMNGEVIWKCAVPPGEVNNNAEEAGRGESNFNRENFRERFRGRGEGGPEGPGRGERGDSERGDRESSDRERGEGERGRRGRFGGRRGGPGGGGSGASYASAITIDFGGVHQIVQLTARTLVGISAEDGKLLWRYDEPANPRGTNCSTPLYQDGLVFASSAYGNGGGAAKLSQAEDGSITAEEVYFTKDMQNHHGGMVIVDGNLYGANGGNGGGFLVCLDFETGELLWRDRSAPKGSLIATSDMLYLLTEEGEILLIEPNDKKYIEKGRFTIPNRSDSPAWTHPAIANGKLYLRDQGNLYAYDIKAGE